MKADTIRRWIRAADTKTPRKPIVRRKSGRPRTQAAIRELVLRIPRETGWGYTRILGELHAAPLHQLVKST